MHPDEWNAAQLRQTFNGLGQDKGEKAAKGMGLLGLLVAGFLLGSLTGAFR
jgi:hypothetical protein